MQVAWNAHMAHGDARVDPTLSNAGLSPVNLGSLITPRTMTTAAPTPAPSCG